MLELNDCFCIHGIAAIIERDINKVKHILIQERQKGHDSFETGLIEIPCGKVKQEESVFDCLRNKVLVETGLTVTTIYGEKYHATIELNEYKVLNYVPFFSTQNIESNYPIVINTFVCKAIGNTLIESFDAKNIRWISLESLAGLITKSPTLFYPMIIMPIKHYLKKKRKIANNF